MKRSGRELTSEVLAVLLDYAWLGNVRELINVVRRMLAMSRRKLLSIEDVPEDLRKSVGVRERKTLRVEPADGTFLGQKTRALRRIEHDYIVEVLQSFFAMEREKAVQVMLVVHTHGKATCGIFTRDIAETKCHQVNEYARECQHPLLCDIDKTD